MGARTYQEIRAYSPQFDCMTARISMADDNGQEYFMLVPQRVPRLRRAERRAACEAIEQAIDARLPAGQVIVDAADWAEMVAEHLRERAA